jgi:hypothetical protein
MLIELITPLLLTVQPATIKIDVAPYSHEMQVSGTPGYYWTTQNATNTMDQRNNRDMDADAD